MPSARKWTEDEDQYLTRAQGAGAHVAVIAKKLGRTEVAVSGRLTWLRRQGRTPAKLASPKMPCR